MGAFVRSAGLRISRGVLSGPAPEAQRLVEPSSESLSFPRERRLLTPGQFRHVQTSGRSVDLGVLVFRVARRPPSEAGPSPSARLGLAVSRRAGNAVARNRIKRLVREAFRKRAGALPGLDVVVSAREGAASRSQADVERLFDELAGRLGYGGRG